MERPTGLGACTSTPHCPSGQARVASESFSELTFSSMRVTCATSTMVSPPRPRILLQGGGAVPYNAIV